MRKLKFSKDEKKELVKEFEKQIETYEESMITKKLSFQKEFNEEADNKLKIVFTPTAYLKSVLLVQNLPGEVGWQGTAEKTGNKTYTVTDVFVYPQVVNGGRALDPTTSNEWYDNMASSGRLNKLRFQAHSHVNMSTEASKTDMENQKQIVKNLYGEGFYLFQIWNKHGEVNSFLYDIDSNIVYDKDDINIEIQLGDGSTAEEFKKNYEKLIGKYEPDTKVRPIRDDGSSFIFENEDNMLDLGNAKLIEEVFQENDDPFYSNWQKGAENWT